MITKFEKKEVCIGKLRSSLTFLEFPFFSRLILATFVPVMFYGYGQWVNQGWTSPVLFLGSGAATFSIVIWFAFIVLLYVVLILHPLPETYESAGEDDPIMQRKMWVEKFASPLYYYKFPNAYEHNEILGDDPKKKQNFLANNRIVPIDILDKDAELNVKSYSYFPKSKNRANVNFHQSNVYYQKEHDEDDEYDRQNPPKGPKPTFEKSELMPEDHNPTEGLA